MEVLNYTKFSAHLLQTLHLIPLNQAHRVARTTLCVNVYPCGILTQTSSILKHTMMVAVAVSAGRAKCGLFCHSFNHSGEVHAENKSTLVLIYCSDLLIP